MSRLTICRLCLGSNMRMFPIVNTPTQQIYEKLTNVPLETADIRPVMACYICYKQLQKCKVLQEMSSNAEQLLTQILGSGLELSEKSISSADRLSNGLAWALAVSQMETITSVHPSLTEVPIVNDVVKVEKKEVKKIELTVPEETEVHQTDDIHQDSTDSEDDLPLKKISLDKEHKSNSYVKVRSRETNNVSRVLKDIKPDAREIILSKDEQLQQLLERSKTLNYINSPYKCESCYKGFVDTKAYENHKLKHDERSGQFECEICHMRYLTARHLRTHVASSHSRQYECNKCMHRSHTAVGNCHMRYLTARHLRTHVASSHSGQYECNKCMHRSHTANQARVHEKWHSGFTYECQLCSQNFKKPTSYLTHMRKRHPTEHVCNICGESFVGKHGLLMHKNKAHRREDQNNTEVSRTNITCVECGIEFASTDAWRKHILSSVKHTLSTNTSSLCLVCNIDVESTNLRVHLLEHENVTRPERDKRRPGIARVPCEQCGANFVNRSKLQAHIKSIHLGLKYNKNIVCEVCGKKCTSNASLKYHQRTHTGERPYSCPLCPKKFTDSNQRRIHVRTHTGERPYCCAACGKRFSQRPALNRHYRVHTGAKPYDCQFCSKTFSQSNSLKLHVNTVHLKLRPNNKKKPTTDEKI